MKVPFVIIRFDFWASFKETWYMIRVFSLVLLNYLEIFYRFPIDCVEGPSLTSSGFEIDFNECHS